MAEVKADLQKAIDSVARWLAVRDHSRYELQVKLAQRYEEDIAAAALMQAEEHGWLADDAEIAERLVNSLNRRNKSRRYIADQLRKRRLPLVNVDGEQEIQKVLDLLIKKFGSVEAIKREDWPRAVRYLKYRGFEDRWIRKVLP
ncbi:MAG: regulatory protein RecX [Bdellovibrionales bacterium]